MNYSNSVDQFIMPRNKNIHIGVFLFVIILSVLTSCEKDEIDKLPSETMSGRNTIGCLINGEVFLPKKTPIKKYFGAFYSQNENYIAISASNLDGFSFDLIIFEPMEGTNTRLCCEEDLYPKLNTVLYTNCGSTYLDGYNLKNNFIDITRFDLEHQIISGTFEIEFKGDSCKFGIYKITDGRFDLTFSIF